MVTPAVAKKHKEDMAREQYIESLGRDPRATGPVPPITTESIFGPATLPTPADIDDSMNLDNEILLPIELPPPPALPTTSTDFQFPSHQHPIPEDDFAPNVSLEDDFTPNVSPDVHQGSPELYDEDLERSAVEEELQAFEDIQYGWHSILSDCYVGVTFSL